MYCTTEPDDDRHPMTMTDYVQLFILLITDEIVWLANFVD